MDLNNSKVMLEVNGGHLPSNTPSDYERMSQPVSKERRRGQTLVIPAKEVSCNDMMESFRGSFGNIIFLAIVDFKSPSNRPIANLLNSGFS